MIRALKILGDISLASIDRGLRSMNPDVEKILKLISAHSEAVDYEDIYYKKLADSAEDIDYNKP